MHKSEVIDMVLTEYNQKEIMDDIRSEAFEDGRLSEIANTEKERKRADDAEVRADAAEERLSQANTYIKELEQKLADLNIASTK